jgi:hypothetical protein
MFLDGTYLYINDLESQVSTPGFCRVNVVTMTNVNEEKEVRITAGYGTAFKFCTDLQYLYHVHSKSTDQTLMCIDRFEKAGWPNSSLETFTYTLPAPCTLANSPISDGVHLYLNTTTSIDTLTGHITGMLIIRLSDMTVINHLYDPIWSYLPLVPHTHNETHRLFYNGKLYLSSWNWPSLPYIYFNVNTIHPLLGASVIGPATAGLGLISVDETGVAAYSIGLSGAMVPPLYTGLVAKFFRVNL